MKSVRFLCFLVLLCLVSNLLISFLAISKVNRSSKDYIVTEVAFVSAVNNAVTNFLSQVKDEDRLASTNESLVSVQVRFVDDMTIYFRPRLSKWVVRFNGCDFMEGDYFDDGVLMRITEGRAYCKSSEGILVLRPRVRSMSGSLQEARRERLEAENESAL